MLTVNQKYIILDDAAAKNGGTSLTLNSILEDRTQDCFFISTTNLTSSFIESNKDKLWILGNIMVVMTDEKIFNAFVELLEKSKFIKIEFDYNFCPYRSETAHEMFGKSKCECPHDTNKGNKHLSKIYDLICKKALHTFFMSERQRALYSTHLPILKFECSSILSSCFSKKSLELLNKYSFNQKNNKYAILEGYGGFHSYAKGFSQAKDYCHANNLEYDVLPNQEFEKHIETLSSYKGLIFLPTIDDTCPRCIIEARLLNIDIICNSNCQHIYEFWWKDKSKTLEYLKSRPAHFWSIIDSL